MWVYESVPRIRVGQGAFSLLGAEAEAFGNRAALLCGRHVIRGGLATRAQESLQTAGLESVVVAGPRGEPTIEELVQALAEIRSASCSLVIGIGGGSVLDMAKAVAGLCRGEEEPHDVVTAAFYEGRHTESAVPWIAVPTTAGTGSEVTHVAVISDPDRGVKQSMRHSSWYAQAVIIDPVLYVTAPPHVTAASGMDAFTQAIESHISLGATPLTQALSRQASILLGQSLLQAYKDGSSIKARLDTALGSCLAGMALTNSRLGAVHGLAHPLGIRYGLAHGLVCAILLRQVMRFNMDVARSGYAELAVAMGLAPEGESSAADRLVTFVEELNHEMQIPSRLGELGMKAAHIPALAEAALSSGSTKANPRSVKQSDLERILTALS